MGQPVTTNPLLISLINMTVVFGVLYGLSLIIRLIKVIDPTQKKKILKPEYSDSIADLAATTEQPIQDQKDHDEFILLCLAAIAAYGNAQFKIVSIRPIGNVCWSQAARVEAVTTRNQIFHR
ncbi:OadG family protein [bacterium BFN5]|nr:OadG family protein [bacterium BFN5]QJW49028.1 OadG family protein [bacterium BFN5]